MASDVTLDATWDDLRAMSINHYFTVISITLLVYEYYLTVVSEIERFWKVGRLNWASGFFYLNRYMVLFGHIPIMVEYFWTTSNAKKIEMSVLSAGFLIAKRNWNATSDFVYFYYYSCRKLQSYHQYLAIAIQLVVACMLIMRMYALYERSRKVLALYVAIAVSAVAIGCWAVIGGKSQKPREALVPTGCSATLTHDQAIRLGAAWTGMLVFDCIVFGMTLYKAITLPRTIGVNLLTVLLRDGTMYFAVMIAANLGNIMTFALCGPFTRGVATTFTNIISSVMIVRLMLNLRHPSLVPHSSRKSHSDFATTMTDNMTFPNLTFVEPQYSSPVADLDELVSSPIAPGHSRSMYDYLAKGSSRHNDIDHPNIELVGVQSSHV